MFKPFQILQLLCITFLLLTCTEENKKPKHWSYAGETSPKHWAEIEPNSQCDGKHQSPVNIIQTETGYNNTLQNQLKIMYNTETHIHDVINNGHTIQFDFETGDSLRYKNQTYHLKQFHFHEPSEHHVDGQAFAMELHLVHQDPHGHVVVVAVLMKLGEENMALATFWDQLPSNVETLLTTDVKLNPQHLIPETRHYFAYEGSLTTPPCTEGVHWIVLRDPIHISADQLEQFLAVCGDNARPVQALHNRTLEAF